MKLIKQRNSESVFPGHRNQKNAFINSWNLLNFIGNLESHDWVYRRCLIYIHLIDQRSHHINFHILTISEEGTFNLSVPEVQKKFFFDRSACNPLWGDFAAFFKENLEPCGLVLNVSEERIIRSWNCNIAILEDHQFWSSPLGRRIVQIWIIWIIRVLIVGG